MQLRKNGIDLTIPDDQAVNLILKALTQDEQPARYVIKGAGGAIMPLPAIGEYWPGMGGIFTGLLPGENGAKYHALVTGPLFNNAALHKDMKLKVEAVEVDGHKDFRLPSRNEQALQYATLKDKFSKEDWYWSNERHPAHESDAYAQHFDNGRQLIFLTVTTCYACAVRIVSIG